MHVREGSDRGEYRVLNHDLPLLLRYGQVFEGSIEMFSIYESPNTHYPWEDLCAPACVDVVLQGQRDRRVCLSFSDRPLSSVQATGRKVASALG